MENTKMHPEELRGIIHAFLQEHRQASLATTFNNQPRTSPVEYFIDDDMNIYIASAGGTKFDAIQQNPNVCLLVNTEFINHRQIKGVQIFGTATTSLQNQGLVSEARQSSPDPFLFNDSTLNIIKIQPQEVVYLNSIGDGDRTKQILRNDEVLVQEDPFQGIH